MNHLLTNGEKIDLLEVIEWAINHGYSGNIKNAISGIEAATGMEIENKEIIWSGGSYQELTFK